MVVMVLVMASSRLFSETCQSAQGMHVSGRLAQKIGQCELEHKERKAGSRLACQETCDMRLMVMIILSRTLFARSVDIE